MSEPWWGEGKTVWIWNKKRDGVRQSVVRRWTGRWCDVWSKYPPLQVGSGDSKEPIYLDKIPERAWATEAEALSALASFWEKEAAHLPCLLEQARKRVAELERSITERAAEVAALRSKAEKALKREAKGGGYVQ